MRVKRYGHNGQIRTLYTALTPEYLFKIPVEETVVVLIDIFRATTTLTAALHAGVKEIIPVPTLEEARRRKGPGILLGGEHKAVKPHDFDLGNSPLEYTPERIGNKKVVFYTTNGTRVLGMLQNARQVIMGSFWNISAVAQYLREQPYSVALVCAGWRSHVALEDSVFAGALVERLQDQFCLYADDPIVALSLWQQAKNDLVGFMARGTHRERLRRQGVERDFFECLRMDVASVIPVWEPPYIKPLNWKAREETPVATVSGHRSHRQF